MIISGSPTQGPPAIFANMHLNLLFISTRNVIKGKRLTSLCQLIMHFQEGEGTMYSESACRQVHQVLFSKYWTVIFFNNTVRLLLTISIRIGIIK